MPEEGIHDFWHYRWLYVRKIHRPDQQWGMLRYLVDRIRGLANVEVPTRTQLSEPEGRDGMLEAIRWRRGVYGRSLDRRHRGHKV
jgi:hypothetical protein